MTSIPLSSGTAAPLAPVRAAVRREPAPYMNPYLAGVGIGLVLLAAFVIMGRGLGASGAFSSVASAGVDAVAPAHAAGNAAYARYLGDGARSPLADWLVFEIIGVVIGGFASGVRARRIRLTTERGATASPRLRLALAFAGGLTMGLGAKLARGCTSGQALTGGALLSAGSWLFIGAAFAAAYLTMPLVRRQWR